MSLVVVDTDDGELGTSGGEAPESVVPMASTLRLRPWQRDAFDRFTASEAASFLAVATPGAGKTTFALACARWTLARRGGHVIVVAPTSHLKIQWTQAAHRLGLQLDPQWSPGQGLARDVHGLVTTYQQIATGEAAQRLAGLCADGLVILDEIHHAGDERAWGDAVRRAFEPAHRRLCLSGTPFRSDTAAIPFVRYEDDMAVADSEYGYGDALRDGGVVRPVYFPRIDGQMEWSAPDGSIWSASFGDELDRTASAQRLRTALSLDGEWLPAVLHQADERLRALRVDHPDAGGLVIAADQNHAQGIANLLRRRLATSAEVVTSDDPGASRKIAEFASSDAAWLVAVRMVSEGVDIPRLRVGVYATSTSTELFFRQAVGRFVRWQAGRASQRAYVFIPDDPRLRAHAFAIAETRRHALRRPNTEDDPPESPSLDDLDTPVPEEEQPEQLSLFAALSAVATGIEVHGVTPGGLRFDDEPETPEPDPEDDPALLLELPVVPTAAGPVHEGRRSIAEIKEELRERNDELAKRLVDRTGWGHARVHGELNRLSGVTSVATATVDQLKRRARQAESWIDRLRGRSSRGTR
jgi:superfamily II DNA or RNA helicase